MTESSDPSVSDPKEVWLARARDPETYGVGDNLFRRYFLDRQDELAKEPFAQEVWDALADAHPRDFLEAATYGGLKPSSVPQFKKTLVAAATNYRNGGLEAGLRLAFYQTPKKTDLEFGIYNLDPKIEPALPFKEEVHAAITARMTNPVEVRKFLSQSPDTMDFLQVMRHQKGMMEAFPFIREILAEVPAGAALAYAKPATAAEGYYSKEKERYALTNIGTMNRLHDGADPTPYRLTDAMGPQQLYELLSYGRADAYTSTFRNVADKLFDHLAPPKDMPANAPDAPGTLAAVMHATPEHKKLLLTFMTAAADYGLLDRVTAALTPKQLDGVLGSILTDVVDYPSEKSAVMLRDLLEKKTTPALRAQIEQKIEQAYRQSTGHATDMLGLVASSYGSEHPEASVFFKLMANNRRYRLPPMDQLDHARAVDADGQHHQGYLFYNDADGKGSFAHFRATYPAREGYKETDHGNFIEITDRTGKLHLLAGKPEAQSGALSEMDAYLSAKGKTFQSFVHRGHSYHLESTLTALGHRDLPLLALGSCGGYVAVADAHKQCPSAHILATHGTGTMLVNDPLLKAINLEILKGHDVVWDDFWKTLPKKIPDPRLADYINPGQNRAVTFLRRLGELEHEPSMAPILPRLLPAQMQNSLRHEPNSIVVPPYAPTTNTPITPRR